MTFLGRLKISRKDLFTLTLCFSALFFSVLLSVFIIHNAHVKVNLRKIADAQCVSAEEYLDEAKKSSKDAQALVSDVDVLIQDVEGYLAEAEEQSNILIETSQDTSSEAQSAKESAEKALSNANSAKESQYKDDAIAEANSAVESANKSETEAQNYLTLSTDTQSQLQDTYDILATIKSLKQEMTSKAKFADSLVKEVESLRDEVLFYAEATHKSRFLYQIKSEYENLTVSFDNLKNNYSSIETAIKDLRSEFDSITQSNTEIEDHKTVVSANTAEAEYVATLVTDYANESQASAKSSANLLAKAVASYSYSGTGLTKRLGRISFNGHDETYYSQRVLPGGGLNIPGRHVDSRGVICDGDGYVCVASLDYPKGTVVETSLGPGKVYDVVSVHGVIDIYTDW